MKNTRHPLAWMATILACVVFTACRTTATGIAPLPTVLEGKETLETKVSKELAPGVAYHHRYFKDPFGHGDGPVSVHFIVIDWKKTGKDFTLAYANCGGRRRHPSKMAGDRHALAVVNGGYHSTKDPSQPYYQMKLDGVVLPSVLKGGDTSLAFNRGEMPVIMAHSQKLVDTYENVLSGDGVTAFATRKQAETKAKRQRSRAPRTFVGQNSTNQVTVFALADGRSKRSIGLDFVEECALVMPFGCEKVLNLDGGGSSVMALRDGEDLGKLAIVNVPSDGCQRRVCDCVLFLDGASLTAAEAKEAAEKK